MVSPRGAPISINNGSLMISNNGYETQGEHNYSSKRGMHYGQASKPYIGPNNRNQPSQNEFTNNNLHRRYNTQQ